MKSPDEIFFKHVGMDQWVGWLTGDGEPEFVRLQFSGESAWMDRPEQFRFRIPVTIQSPFSSKFRLLAEGLAFNGQLETDLFSGQVTRTGFSGGFRFHRVHPEKAKDFEELIGYYQPPKDGEILLSRDLREQDSIYFYSQKEGLVRIYPIAADRWMSEYCETIQVKRDMADAVEAIVFEKEDQNRFEAQRIKTYTEEELSVQLGGYCLSGSLLKPLGEGPFPAVIFCHLAGIHLRDYYRIYAGPFVKKGFAVLIYDKRGRGQSTGEPQFSNIFHLAKDCAGFYQVLRMRADIQSETIGFWGMSNGGWVAPLTASRVENPAFVICVSGASVSPERQEQIRRANVVREAGASPRAVSLIDRLWGLLFRFCSDGVWNDELETILKEVYEDEELQALPPYPGYAPELQAVPPKIPFEILKANWKGSDGMEVFDPVPVYLKLTCPMLFIWGDQDTVIPLEESLDRAGEAIRRRGNPDDRISVYPRVNHLLYQVKAVATGIPAGVMETEMHHVDFAEGAREAMAAWAAGCCKPGT